MQQPCQRCGYDSDRPARFCRQCGAPLFAENEATSATTRQYAPQPSSNSYDAPYQSQFAQDARRNDQVPDTSSLHRAPMAQNYPNYPANYQYPEPKKSGAWKWVLITLLCVALVSGGIGVMVISAIRAKQRAEVFMPSSEEIEARVREQIQAELERAKEEAARAAEEANRAAEDAGAAVPPPPPPAPGGLPAGMERYKYPNAEIKNSNAVFGNEFARMITSDSVSKVRDFYKKQVGDPIINNKDESDESVIFQVPGSPMIIITVNQDDEDSDKTQIVVLRSRFQIPKMN